MQPQTCIAHTHTNEFLTTIMQRIKRVLGGPNICYPDVSNFELL
jgi:hypothetical protein